MWHSGGQTIRYLGGLLYKGKYCLRNADGTDECDKTGSAISESIPLRWTDLYHSNDAGTEFDLKKVINNYNDLLNVSSRNTRYVFEATSQNSTFCRLLCASDGAQSRS